MTIVKLITTCSKTYKANLYLEELMNVKLVLVEDTPLRILLLGIHLPPNARVDASSLKKMLMVTTRAFNYTIFESFPDYGYRYRISDQRSVVALSGDFTEYDYSGPPIYFVEDIRYAYTFQLQMVNQCNRSCKWCPPYHRRPAKKELMSREVLDRILIIMADYGIGKLATIQLSRISELTTEIDYMTDNMEYIKGRYPNLRISIVTNGDWVRAHAPEEVTSKLKNVDNFLMNDYEGDTLTADVLSGFGDSRGGTIVPDTIRSEPHCWDRRRRVAFDVNGDIMACCRVTKLDPNHKQYVLGNIMDYDNWADLKATLDAWEMVPDCTKCVDSIQQMLKSWKPKTGHQYPRHENLDDFDTQDIDIVEVT